MQSSNVAIGEYNRTYVRVGSDHTKAQTQTSKHWKLSSIWHYLLCFSWRRNTASDCWSCYL